MTYLTDDKQVFLLTFTGFRLPVTSFLDTRPEVLNWFLILENAILVVSREDASTLAHLVHQQFPGRWILVTEVAPDPHKTNGWMNQKVWEFINNPKSSGRWE